jgi:cell division protease FtsH
MVTEYGMSDLGPIQLETKTEGVFLGRDYTKTRNFSDQVALEIDKEIQKIIGECYKKSQGILKKNEKLVNLISDALIAHETLTKEQIDELVKTGKYLSEDEAKEEVANDSKKQDK